MKDNSSPSAQFYKDLPLLEQFTALDPDAFAPLPDDWTVGCCDIVDSTGLIERGQYKTVNMVGAAAIAALRNSLKELDFPFVFGGDGASFALPPDGVARASRELARLQNWVAQEFTIDLRAALAPVSDLRDAGQEVRLARFGASDDVDYAMFDGGGLSWLEGEMKAGRIALAHVADPTPPDLTGLSCRWDSTTAQNGVILSILVKPRTDAPRAAVLPVFQAILSLAEKLDRGGHPLPSRGPNLRFPPPGLAIEAQLLRGKTPAILRKASLFVTSALIGVLFSLGRKLGDFDPEAYRASISTNADFRKFDDGLKMTLDCTPEIHARIKAELERARQSGLIDYGLFAQNKAIVTCIVPSAMQADHMHFVDGADGGYARAAQMMRAQA